MRVDTSTRAARFAGSVLHNVARCFAVAHDALCDRQQPARLVFVDRAQCEAFSARARFNGSFVIEIAGDSIHRSEQEATPRARERLAPLYFDGER